MTVPGVYSPSQGDPFAATIRAAAESDGVITDAVKVEAMARAMCVDQYGGYEDEWLVTANCPRWELFRSQAYAALNALRALEGE